MNTTTLPAALIAATALLAAPAWSSAQESTTNLDAVSIVGSRAKARTVFDSDVPIDVFSQKDVQRALATGELGQALQSLVPSINMPRVSASGTSDTIRTIQLRGLAPDQVLVLVNGKRWHPNATLDQEGLFKGTVSVDLNAIPPSAIERIEVLRDGAGALYGSDAVAGVINIVLKKSPEGGEAYVSYGANNTRFEPTDRTITDGQNLQTGATLGLRLPNDGSLRFGFDWQGKKGTNRAGIGGDFSDNGTAADEAQVGRVLYHSGDPDLHNTNLFFNAAMPVAPSIEAYSFATLNRRRSYGAAFFRWPGDSSNVPAAYPNGYLPQTTNKSPDTGIVGGLRGSAGEWAWDASLRNGNNRFRYGVQNSLNSSLGAASPTAFHLADFVSNQTGLNVDVKRSLDGLGLPAPLNLALGAEWLHDSYRTEPGDAASYAAGSFGGQVGAQAGPGLQPADAVDLSRNAKSLYVNVDSDLTNSLLLGAAARYSKYDGFGSATTGKLSGRYKFTPELLVRGSLSNSFRAPALAQTGFRFSSLNFNSDGTGLVNSALLPATDALAQKFGAQPLKAEKSTNLSLGFAAQFPASVNLSVDVYRIKIKDRISRTSDLNSDAVGTYLGSIGRSDIASVAFLTNALDTTTTGLDFVASRDQPLAGGTLSLSGAVNFNRTRLDAVRNGSAALTAIDSSLTLFDSKTLFDTTHGSPTNKLILGAEWTGGPWALSTRATRFGEFQIQSFDGSEIRYRANWSIDLQTQFKATSALTLSIGGNNVFDKYPDKSGSSDDLFGHLPYNYVAPIGINGAYFYARADYRF